ncbi:YbjQ family protein [Agrobacterium rosae]|uniref:Heavy metal-binding domain-containing protein n=1 Tax=Agrobacterium rosae TaxID=1972867 RepID=A0AAW9FF95_9HYPH|nr:heavy metal-binding domain-containing protein [Agrobacterium rosae]MDX8301503.1 heavy metal-binding domain-containing protein [Agrobacterium rosae]
MPKCKSCGTDFWISGTEYCVDCEGREASKRHQALIDRMVLTTSIDVPNRDIENVISIVASETAIGMSIFKDIANNWRDFVGGKSQTSQNALRETREACIDGLKLEAAKLGADAVIAVDFTYNQLNTSGPGGILFVAATGTAVSLKPVT